MGTKTKIALAGTFVGLVAMAAAAFGQTGSGSGSDSGAQTTKYPTQQRRAAAAQNGG